VDSRARAPLEVTPVPQLWRGSVLARGYWIDPTLPDARRRVIERWTPGAELRAVPGDGGAPGGWLLLVAAPERVLAPPPGLVVAENGGGLSALSNVAARPGEVVLPAGGVTHRFELAKLEPVDPSAWVTLDLEVVHTTALGPPPAPPQAPRVVTPRAVFGRPELSPEQRALLVSLREPPPPPPPPNMAARLAWLVGLGPLAKRGAPPPRGPGAPNVVQPRDGAPSLPAPRGPVRDFLERLLAPLWTPVAQAANDALFERLGGLFDEGKLDEALRWAIPLGDGSGETLGPSTSLPTPRASLQLGTGRGGPSRTVSATPSYFEQLRAQYRRAYEALLAEGRIDEAVFVLAELLGQRQEAVDLLEKHGRFGVAADLAEAAGLPPERVVRLLCRAGRTGDAILVARRAGAFQAAVTELKKVDPALATDLRWAWAEHLASRGDSAGACTVAWEEPALRPRTVPWLDAAITSNTPAGARLLGHLLRQTETTFEIVRPRVEALLLGEGFERVRMRRELAEGLSHAGPHGRILLRPVLRRLVADSAATPQLVPADWLRAALARADEPAFVADIPVIPPAPRPSGLETVEIGAGDRGLGPVSDLLLLPDGGVLVALGELGAVLYGPRGRVRARFDEPVHALVPIEGTRRAIGVGTRRWGARLCQVECGAEPAAAHWHDGRYTCWEAQSDGSLFFVGTAEGVLALDALDAGARALWRGTADGVDVQRVARGTSTVAFAGPQREGPGEEGDRHSQWSRWVLRRGDLKVQSSDVVPAPEGLVTLLGDGDVHISRGPAPVPTPGGTTPAVLHLRHAPGTSTAQRLAPPLVSWMLEGQDPWTLEHAAVDPPHSVTVLGTPGEQVVLLASGDVVSLVVRLRGAGRAVVRLARDTLCIGDDCGRALVIELATRKVLRDLRVG